MMRSITSSEASARDSMAPAVTPSSFRVTFSLQVHQQDTTPMDRNCHGIAQYASLAQLYTRCIPHPRQQAQLSRVHALLARANTSRLIKPSWCTSNSGCRARHQEFSQTASRGRSRRLRTASNRGSALVSQYASSNALRAFRANSPRCSGFAIRPRMAATSPSASPF